MRDLRDLTPSHKNEELVEHIRWVANVVHQAYHQSHMGRWSHCGMDICASTVTVLTELGWVPDPAVVEPT